MPTVTLLAIRNKIKDELDLEDEDFIEDTELDVIINDSIRDVESIIHTLYEDYYLTSATLSLVSGTSVYSLPTDIFSNKIRKIIYDDGALKYVVDKIKDIAIIPNIATGDFYRYLLINSTASGFQIKIYPTPTITDSTSMTVWYLRKSKELSVDADTCDIPITSINYLYARIKQMVLQKEGNPMLQAAAVETESLKQGVIDTLSNRVPDDDNKIVIEKDFYWDME